MKANPKISVVVPIYNAEKFIDRCMASIYEQTFTDYEIILVNDGSTDNSLEMCRAYAEKDERITVIDKKNGGAGSARNAGMLKAKGEYIAFPDVDDWFERNMYKDLYTLAKENDYDMVFSGVNYYSPDIKYQSSIHCEKVEFLSRTECRENVMKLFPTTTIFDVPWNKLYRREIIEKKGVRFTDYKRCQDAIFNLDFYNASEKVVSTEKIYYNYITNSQAGVDRKFPKNYIDINIYYYTHLMEVLKTWGIYESKIKEHYDTSLIIAVYETALMFDNPRWKLTKKEQKQYIKDIFERKELVGFMDSASVREDARIFFEIIKNKDVKAVLKAKRKEKIKDKLRKTVFYKILRKIRKR